MAGWTLPGVGKHYQLPSNEDTLEEYRKIEHLLTFEPRESEGRSRRAVVSADSSERVSADIDRGVKGSKRKAESKCLEYCVPASLSIGFRFLSDRLQ